jgi:hypothetical protein
MPTGDACFLSCTPCGIQTHNGSAERIAEGNQEKCSREATFTPCSRRCAWCAGVSGGAGFNELAGYIFGGNQENVKMEMTTPVFTETAPGQAGASMQFVLEPK